MTIYTFPEPFETALYGERGDVVAYRNGGFLFVRATGSVTWTAADHLNPPPPIPAAARKPKVGEVWMCDDGDHVAGAAMIIRWCDVRQSFCAVRAATGLPAWIFPDYLTRPATPQESEPFRPLLEGLKRSLGED